MSTPKAKVSSRRDAPGSDGRWIQEAEKALDSGGVPEDSKLRVLRGESPPLLDAEGTKAALAPVLAALVWAAAIFREMLTETPLDPMAVLLRLLALALTLRVIVLGAQIRERVRVFVRSRSYGLVLAPAGLFYRSPEVDLVLQKSDIVGIAARTRAQSAGRGRAWLDVYLATDPSTGRTHVTLPPVFDGSPTLLVERLQRWLGSADDIDKPHVSKTIAPMKMWDAAAEGVVPEGGAVVRHGWQWLEKAPYPVVLVALIAIESMVRAGPEVWLAIDPLIGGGLVLALLLVPGRWLWMTRRDVRPRRGVALVLTPAEVLMREGSQVFQIPWPELSRVSTDARRTWSVLKGAHEARQLAFQRTRLPTIRFDEPYLGVPVEVGALLVDAYARGVLPKGGVDATPYRGSPPAGEAKASATREAGAEEE